MVQHQDELSSFGSVALLSLLTQVCFLIKSSTDRSRPDEDRMRIAATPHCRFSTAARMLQPRTAGVRSSPAVRHFCDTSPAEFTHFQSLIKQSTSRALLCAFAFSPDFQAILESSQAASHLNHFAGQLGIGLGTQTPPAGLVDEALAARAAASAVAAGAALPGVLEGADLSLGEVNWSDRAVHGTQIRLHP